MAKIHGYHTSEAGTKVPLLDLRGKPYLQVAHRLVLFREKYPSGIIKTQMIHDNEGEATFRAEIYVEGTGGQPMMVSTGHKSESKESFSDYREKAETGAIGRALALAGIGTQFCEVDLDEQDRLADAPITPAKRSTSSKTRSSFRNRSKKSTSKAEESLVGDDI